MKIPSPYASEPWQSHTELSTDYNLSQQNAHRHNLVKSMDRWLKNELPSGRLSFDRLRLTLYSALSSRFTLILLKAYLRFLIYIFELLPPFQISHAFFEWHDAILKFPCQVPLICHLRNKLCSESHPIPHPSWPSAKSARNCRSGRGLTTFCNFAWRLKSTLDWLLRESTQTLSFHYCFSFA